MEQTTRPACATLNPCKTESSALIAACTYFEKWNNEWIELQVPSVMELNHKRDSSHAWPWALNYIFSSLAECFASTELCELSLANITSSFHSPRGEYDSASRMDCQRRPQRPFRVERVCPARAVHGSDPPFLYLSTRSGSSSRSHQAVIRCCIVSFQVCCKCLYALFFIIIYYKPDLRSIPAAVTSYAGFSSLCTNSDSFLF